MEQHPKLLALLLLVLVCVSMVIFEFLTPAHTLLHSTCVRDNRTKGKGGKDGRRDRRHSQPIIVKKTNHSNIQDVRILVLAGCSTILMMINKKGKRSRLSFHPQ